MKIKSQLTLATLIVAGMFATGCQQMSQMNPMSQQTAQQAAPAATQEPAAAAAPTGNDHTHPPIPGCTDSITHNHPSNNPNHTHTYGCKGGHKAPAVPHVKAKGNYKGPVKMEQSSKEVMQQYQK